MIDFIHKTHPRSKSIKIHVSPKGEVIVTTPRFTPHWGVKLFVKKSEPWILQQLEQLKHKQAINQTDSTLQIFGKSYQKLVQADSSKKLGIHVSGDQLIINPIETTTTAIDKEIIRYLKSTAERYILPRTQQLATKMRIKFNHITLRQQKTRWGSCSSQGNLNFNWRLVHYQPEIIDYVIIHELAHRVYMDHSSQFWNLVKKYDPEFLSHRGWLKRHGLSLG